MKSQVEGGMSLESLAENAGDAARRDVGILPPLGRAEGG